MFFFLLKSSVELLLLERFPCQNVSVDCRFTSLKLDDQSLATRQAASDTFRKFDGDGNGTIDRREFDPFYKDMRANGLTKEPKESVWEWLSKGGDFIGFNRYVDWLDKQGSQNIRTLLTDAELMKATAHKNK